MFALAVRAPERCPVNETSSPVHQATVRVNVSPSLFSLMPEKRQGAQKAAYAVFFAMLRHSCESCYFLKNPSPFLGYMGI